MTGVRGKKEVLLIIDILAITFSFVVALLIRYKSSVISLSSYIISYYVPLFAVVLAAYIVYTMLRSEIRIERMSLREIIQLTFGQQTILTVGYIFFFYLIHSADAISRIVVGFFYILNVACCCIGRILYHFYCTRKKAEPGEERNSGLTEEKAQRGMDSESEAENHTRHVYIIGSKSIGQYGGYETFVMNLLRMHEGDRKIKYHVACKANGQGFMSIDDLPGATKINDQEFSYCGAQCFLIKVPEKLGSAQAIYYDLKALRWCCEHMEKNHIDAPTVYILANRIGPFEKKYVKRIHACGGRLIQNPDGLEHKRRKWSPLVQKYWKLSEKFAIKYADIVVCDSKHIESYIREEYYRYDPQTTYIAYGSDIQPSRMQENDPIYLGWLKDHNLRDKEFYLSVGRFVPENNYDIMIREFMASSTDKDYAIITTENPRFAAELQQKYNFRADKRIKFVGTVYDADLLKRIRENACGYLHGHEVGGTNPSLLEALGSTKVNLLLDVGFNREVGDDAAFYWTKEEGSLARLINKTDEITEEERNAFEKKAKRRIEDTYSWEMISETYRRLWDAGEVE